MTLINLLPWRERARKEKKVNFLILIGGFLVAMLGVIVISHLFISYLIRKESKINDFLQAELLKERTVLTSLIKTQKSQALVTKNLQAIFALKQSGYDAVRLLDELAHVVPDTVILTGLLRKQNTIILKGKAQSNLQVTLFMDNIEKSYVFIHPVLTEITSTDKDNGDQRDFILKFELRGTDYKTSLS